MNHTRLHSIFFSPAETSKKILRFITAPLPGQAIIHDITPDRPVQPVSFGPDDLVIVGVPVYAGRVPELAAKRLAAFTGKNTPAVAVAVYGNRAYEDALLELKNILTDAGFNVFAGAAFIGQHCIVPKVAAHRPDDQDAAVARAFAEKCLTKLQALKAGETVKLAVNGNFPYREPNSRGLFPSADASCTLCGSCVSACPASAIPAETPNETTVARCISCTACISICPEGARAFRGEMYTAMARQFEAAFSARKEPELFV